MSVATDQRLDPVVDLLVERLLLTDGVAAAKFGTGSPVDDPTREEQLLDQVRTQAGTVGVDPDVAVAFMQDQIDASKLVQRGLITRWAAHPEEAPTEPIDLRQVRARLDRLTMDLLRELAAIGRRCDVPAGRVERFAAAVHGSTVERLDGLHRGALETAMRSIGGPGGSV